MSVRYFLFILLVIFLTTDVVAQKIKTNVKGYFRKDGTYVRPNTRTYNLGKSTNSNSSSYNSSFNLANLAYSSSSIVAQENSSDQNII